jgi:ribonuclease E
MQTPALVPGLPLEVSMKKELLINVSEGEECRIALLEDGKLEELYMERASSTSHVGNIYKGKVTNVEASIQAAFVDFGLGRNGFLHISDLMPTYFGRRGEGVVETVGRKLSRRERPPIQQCLRRGDEIVVQIIKEGIGTKGPTLSTYLSIPGRVLVMMPGMGKMGVSKKIEDDEERRRLRQILDSLEPPDGVGFIIRTAGIGKTKAEIERDLKYLTRLWEQLNEKQKTPGPVELYTEGDLVTRTVRDVWSADIDRITVDNKDVARRIRDFFKLALPRSRNKVELHDEPIPLFHKYDIEKEIEQIYSRHVPLPSGGSLVIDSTEAIVAIDVNSGKFRDHKDAETTAFRTDLEAADEIPRQLRLRDLGGVIICDFIDLRFERHRRELERRLHENLKNDRAKTKVLRMSQFGIIEMTRQRMRPSLKRSIYCDCAHCKGSGLVKTPESMSLDVMRRLAIAVSNQRVERVELTVNPEVATFLLNRKRSAIAELETQSGKRIAVLPDPRVGGDEVRFTLYDQRDGLVFLAELGMTPGGRQEEPRRRHQQPTGSRRDRRGPKPVPQRTELEFDYADEMDGDDGEAEPGRPPREADGPDESDELLETDGAEVEMEESDREDQDERDEPVRREDRRGDRRAGDRRGDRRDEPRRDEPRRDEPRRGDGRGDRRDEPRDEPTREERRDQPRPVVLDLRAPKYRQDTKPATPPPPPPAEPVPAPTAAEHDDDDYYDEDEPQPNVAPDGTPLDRGQSNGGNGGQGGEGGRRRRRRRRRRGGGSQPAEANRGQPAPQGGRPDSNQRRDGGRHEGNRDRNRQGGQGGQNRPGGPRGDQRRPNHHVLEAGGEDFDVFDDEPIEAEAGDTQPTGNAPQQPAGNGGNGGEQGEGGRRRRRRRRGGRGRRRRGPGEQGGTQQGGGHPGYEIVDDPASLDAPVGAAARANDGEDDDDPGYEIDDRDERDIDSADDDRDLQPRSDRDDDRDEEPGPAPEPIEDEPATAAVIGVDDDADDELDDEVDDDEVEVATPAAEIPAPVEPAVEPEPEAPAPAKKRAKRATKPKEPKAPKAAKKTVKKAVKKTAKKTNAKAGAKAVATPEIEPTGSSDRHHLAGDEPVEPPPVERPNTRFDLDAIPDDYDD